MEERLLLRIGALGAFVGGGLALIGNAAHPRLSVDELNSDPAAVLQAVSDFGPWKLVHLAIIIGLLLWLATFAALSRSVADRVTTWARLSWVSVVVAIAVTIVALIVDGFALATVAERYTESSGAEQAAVLAGAEAVDAIASAAFGTWQVLIFFATILFGVAIADGGRYPVYLAWVAYLAGALGVISGVIQLFAGYTVAGFLIIFSAASVLATLWILVIGWQQWKMSMVRSQ